MRDAGFRADAGCRRGMRIHELSGELREEPRPTTTPQSFLPDFAFLFCILHRVEIPHSASHPASRIHLISLSWLCQAHTVTSSRPPRPQPVTPRRVIEA